MKKIEAVKVSFITFLQARLLLQGSPLATSIDDWIELTISLNKSKIIKKLRSSFEAFENGKYSSEIIEFELDSLDRNLILFFLSNVDKVDLRFNETSNKSIKIYSKNSFVDAGYLELMCKNVKYHGVVPKKNDPNKIFLECKPFYKADYIESLSDFKTATQKVQVVIDIFPKFLLTSDFGFDSRTNYRTYLLDPINKRESIFTSLHINHDSQIQISLTPKSAEAVLQLSAAHENGYYIIVNSLYDKRFLIFKIPELTDSSNSYKLWINNKTLTNSFFKYDIGTHNTDIDSVNLDINLSIECSKIFNWFLPNNLKDIARCSSLLTN